MCVQPNTKNLQKNRRLWKSGVCILRVLVLASLWKPCAPSVSGGTGQRLRLGGSCFRSSGVLDSSGSRSTGVWGLCMTEDLLLAFRKAVGKTREKRRNGLENKKQMKPRMRVKEQTILAEGGFACKHGNAIFNLVYRVKSKLHHRRPQTVGGNKTCF